MYFKCIINVIQLNRKVLVGENMKLNLHDKKPFYLQIRNDIKEKIENKFWKEGELIPTEMELVKSYSVSRVTIRSAISYLVKEGYLQRVAGFGTTVIMNKPSLQHFTLIRSSTNEMKEMGLTTKTLKAEVKTVKANEYLAGVFGIKTGDKLINLIRVRGESSPILLSDTYLVPSIKIPKDRKILMGSLYEYLASKGIYFSKFDEYVSAVPINDMLKEQLEINDDSPILKRKRFSYDENNKLIEYTETFYNSKLYEYRTNLIYRR